LPEVVPHFVPDNVHGESLCGAGGGVVFVADDTAVADF
jgi:hypothetical protein